MPLSWETVRAEAYPPCHVRKGGDLALFRPLGTDLLPAPFRPRQMMLVLAFPDYFFHLPGAIPPPKNSLYAMFSVLE